MAKRYKPEGKDNDNGCCFEWNVLKEMKENNVEFWAADEYNKLQSVEIDERAKKIYMICRLSGRITWPLNFEKLEEVHRRGYMMETLP